MNQPSGDPQNGPQPTGVNATLFTQEQVNHFNAEAKRTALNGFFKDLGLDGVPSVDDLKGVFAKAQKQDDLEAGEKTEVQRLTGDLTTARETAAQVPTLKEQYRRAELAGEEGLKPRYWKYIEGKTDEEIKASIAAVKADIGGGGSGDGDQGGDGGNSGGNQGGAGVLPNPQQGVNGGGSAKKTLSSGAEAYKAKYKKE